LQLLAAHRVRIKGRAANRVDVAEGGREGARAADAERGVGLARSAPLAVKQASGILTTCLPLPARRWNRPVASSAVPPIAMLTLPAGADCTMVSKRRTASLLAAAGSASAFAPCASRLAGPVQVTSLASCWVLIWAVATVMPGRLTVAFRSAPSGCTVEPLRTCSGKLARSAWPNSGTTFEEPQPPAG
jgi:hypothetical protein